MLLHCLDLANLLGKPLGLGCFLLQWWWTYTSCFIKRKWRVQQRDYDALRFVCWPDCEFTKDPVDYLAVVHLFGFTCSPSIAVEFNSGSDLCERVLCVHWNVDRNACGSSVEENGNVTRTVQSTICSSYDSLDFAPAMITANVFMYELCRHVASWDEREDERQSRKHGSLSSNDCTTFVSPDAWNLRRTSQLWKTLQVKQAMRHEKSETVTKNCRISCVLGHWL